MSNLQLLLRGITMAIISNLNLSGPLLTSWELLQSNKTATAGVVVLGFLLWFFSAKNNHLRDIPGPFWGSVTNLYRLIDQASLSSHKNHIALHKKYGRFVRYGPNFVSISDPKGIQDIYGLGTGFYKARMMDGSSRRCGSLIV